MKLRGSGLETQIWESLACVVIKLFPVAEISQRAILSEKRAKDRVKVELIFKERRKRAYKKD